MERIFLGHRGDCFDNAEEAVGEEDLNLREGDA